MSRVAEDLQSAFLDLETGICLWIGAGVTKYLARELGGTVPDWNALTTELEGMARIAPQPQRSNPERLQACIETLGASKFRQVISRQIYGQLCALIATFAHRNRGQLATPPAVAFHLAALAWPANPIVNFNVETITSYLLARPAGPCRILPYRLRDSSRAGVFEEQETSSAFFRTVYHPHGAVNYGGQAVMSSSEYQAHNGSLAYLLAVTAAFENNLWIVGMSIDDTYLRKQLKMYRTQINQVRWFDSEDKLKKHGNWAKDARVTQIPVVWSEFWQIVGRELGGPVRRAGVMTAWSLVLLACIRELTEGEPAAQLESLAGRLPQLSAAAKRAAAESRAGYRHVFQPDEGRRLLPDVFDEHAIRAEVDAAIQKAAELFTQVQSGVLEVGSDAGRDIVSALEHAKPRLPAMRYMNI